MTVFPPEETWSHEFGFMADVCAVVSQRSVMDEESRDKVEHSSM